MPKIMRCEEDRIGDIEIAVYNYRIAYQAFSQHCDRYGTSSQYDKVLSAERVQLHTDWLAKRAKVVAMANQLEIMFDTELITLP